MLVVYVGIEVVTIALPSFLSRKWIIVIVRCELCDAHLPLHH